MAKLVILTQGMNGRAHELKADKTTIGRVEDNTFQIAESSVSSHHCEVLLRGNEVVIKDLNSTNGTFINDEKISESVLDEFPGIGERRKAALLKKFGSVRRLQLATLEQITEVAGFGGKAAEELKKFLAARLV